MNMPIESPPVPVPAPAATASAERFADVSRPPSAETQRAGPDRLEAGACRRIAAGKQRHVMSKRHQFVDQPGDHTLRAAVQPGRNAFSQRRKLGDPHAGSASVFVRRRKNPGHQRAIAARRSGPVVAVSQIYSGPPSLRPAGPGRFSGRRPAECAPLILRNARLSASSTSSSRRSAVNTPSARQPLRIKIILFTVIPICRICASVPCPSEGRIAIVTTRGCGMRRAQRVRGE